MNTTNQPVKKDAPDKQPFSIKENKKIQGSGEYNGNEEPVEERSDKIYNEAGNTKSGMPSPEPDKTEKKIPSLRKES